MPQTVRYLRGEDDGVYLRPFSVRARCRSLAIVLIWVFLTGEHWPQFRGPGGQGHSAEGTLPLIWSETKGIRWKTAVPGAGWSSPVIEGKEIWLTTATDGKRSLRALALDAGSGQIRNNIEVFRLNAAVEGHAKNSGASPSAVIEGDRVYVHFGWYGTACLRRNGTV